LSGATVAGEAGCGAEAGVDWLTQHFLPHAHAHFGPDLPSAPAARTELLPSTSKALNKIAKAVLIARVIPYSALKEQEQGQQKLFLFFFGFSFFDLFGVFLWVLLKILQTILAAQFDFAVIVGKYVRFAHRSP
jgi:hypothetical protein